MIRAYSIDSITTQYLSRSAAKVHSVYKNAVSLESGDRLITLVPFYRGEGPGFILLPPGFDFTVILQGRVSDKVDYNRETAVLQLPGLEISLKESPRFDSLWKPSAIGGVDIRKVKDNMIYIENALGSRENFSKSFISLLPGMDNTTSGCGGDNSCVTPVWQKYSREIMSKMSESINNLSREDFTQSLGKLVGLGWGLTPGGDDFILGMTGICYFLAEISFKDGKCSHFAWTEKNSFIRDNINENLPGLFPRTNFISRSYLRYALENRYLKCLALFIENMIKGELEKPEGKKSMEQLLKYGSVSGMDSMAGILFTLTTLM